MVNLLGRDQRPPPRAASLDVATRALLEARLAETLAFAGLADPARPLAERFRSPALEPDLEEDATLAGFEAALHALAERRRRLVESAGIAVARTPGLTQSGARLVVVEVDASVADGRAEAASRGFFDLDDRPPWDLWLVAFGVARPSAPDAPGIGLIGLVPADCVTWAEAGRRAGGRGCLHWLPVEA